MNMCCAHIRTRPPNEMYSRAEQQQPPPGYVAFRAVPKRRKDFLFWRDTCSSWQVRGRRCCKHKGTFL